MAKVLLGTDPGPPLTHGLLRIYLESAGHQVHELCDGEALLAEAAAGAAPDVLVLDTALPSLDGFQVLARLQAQAATPRVPILVISTIPPQLGRRLVESMGAAVYLRKPFAFETLRVALDEMLAPPPGTTEATDGPPPQSGQNGAGAEPASGPDQTGANGATAHQNGNDRLPPQPLRDNGKAPRRSRRERPAG